MVWLPLHRHWCLLGLATAALLDDTLAPFPALRYSDGRASSALPTDSVGSFHCSSFNLKKTKKVSTPTPTPHPQKNLAPSAGRGPHPLRYLRPRLPRDFLQKTGKPELAAHLRHTHTSTTHTYLKGISGIVGTKQARASYLILKYAGWTMFPSSQFF